MEKRFLFSIALFLLIQQFVFAGRVVKVYEFDNPVIEKSGIYSTIYFDGAKLAGEAGKATLPFYPVKLLLSPGEIAVSIDIRYEKPVKLTGEFVLMPHQEVRPLSDQRISSWLIDQKFYSSSVPYPSSYKPHFETQFYNGCGIALSAFSPVKYLPSKKQVVYYQRVVVTIETASDPDLSSHQRLFFPSVNKADHLKGIVQNPDEITQYFQGRELRTNAYDYLIITKNQYLSNFDNLASFYKPRGIKT
ncbi:MAG: hypothetical protein HGA23_03360, partial [Bacteroidales bacterium]|nr:hypothetical protein [Bacteroidales bacterium]